MNSKIWKIKKCLKIDFFRFQKKPKFNRGILGKPDFDPFFDPPRKPPFWPLLATFGDPLKTPKNPQKPPKMAKMAQNGQKWQKSRKMALLAKTGVFDMDLNRKKGGPWVNPHPPTPPPFGPPHLDPPQKPPKTPFFWPFFGQNLGMWMDFSPPGQTSYI